MKKLRISKKTISVLSTEDLNLINGGEETTAIEAATLDVGKSNVKAIDSECAWDVDRSDTFKDGGNKGAC